MITLNPSRAILLSMFSLWRLLMGILQLLLNSLKWLKLNSSNGCPFGCSKVVTAVILLTANASNPIENYLTASKPFSYTAPRFLKFTWKTQWVVMDLIIQVAGNFAANIINWKLITAWSLKNNCGGPIAVSIMYIHKQVPGSIKEPIGVPVQLYGQFIMIFQL